MPLPIRLICLTTFLFSSINAVVADDDDDKQPRHSAANALAATQAEPSLQHKAGIKTQRLQSATRATEFSTYGKVLSLEPLLALRQQYLAAQAQQDSAAAKYQEADLNLHRTRNLHQQDIVSTRRLQEQQALWRNEKANLATSNYQQQTILAASRLQWGDTLTRWFTQNQDKQAEQFLGHRAQLLQITLPPNSQLAPDVFGIEVDEHGRRDQAIKATLISPAPQVDPITQGERYFFKTEGRSLPFGAYISAWITHGKQQSAGVIIPESAVVWHLGQALVFIKTEDGEFSRRLLAEQIPVKGGYFAASGFKADEEIVTIGAQTLLSQELKNLIPSEDDD